MLALNELLVLADIQIYRAWPASEMNVLMQKGWTKEKQYDKQSIKCFKLQAWWWSEEWYLQQNVLKTGNSCVIKQ